MIDVNQWRVCIGLWACHQISYSTHSKETPNTESSSRIDGVTIIRKIKDLTFSLGVFLSLLLILSGDVELNPGPKTGDSNIKINSLCPFYIPISHLDGVRLMVLITDQIFISKLEFYKTII